MNILTQDIDDSCKLWLGTLGFGTKLNQYVYNQSLYNLFLANHQKADSLEQIQQLINGEISCEELQGICHQENCFTIMDMPALNAELIHFIDCYGGEFKGSELEGSRQHFSIYLATFSIGSTSQTFFEQYLVLQHDVKQRLLLGEYIQQFLH